MDPDSTLSTALFLAALLAANIFFVITEFALLTLRRGRIEQNAGGGAVAAAGTMRMLDRSEALALLAQTGRSAATLLFGYLAARQGLAWAGPGDAGEFLAVGLALALAAIIHTVIGAQVPKLLGVQKAKWAVHTSDEIRLLVSRGHEQGMVEEDEREMIHGVFEFSDTVAREVMTPRTDMIAVPLDVSRDDLIRILVEEGHSRLPVYDGTIDTIVGVLLAKDLLPLLSGAEPASPNGFDVRTLMREPYFVPDAKPVDEILAEFRQQSVHLAIVVDEFGGTDGLVSMEDLLEEIVGEIHDEHDTFELDFTPTPDGDVLIDGGAAISEVNEKLGLTLPEDDYDTIGGFVFGALGRVPTEGDEVPGVGPDPEMMLMVEEIEDRRVVRLRLTRSAAVAAAAD
jgi:CBS domain containing-hemolysin-like protein